MILFTPGMVALLKTSQLYGKQKPTLREKELGFVRTGAAGYSAAKARYIQTLVADFQSGRISAAKVTCLSDRGVAKLLSAPPFSTSLALKRRRVPLVDSVESILNAGCV